MVNILRGSDIVELGIQIEINGRDFYNEAGRKIKDKRSKEIFKYLADEEEKHIATFMNILYRIKTYEPLESFPDDYFAYMNALASEYVFTQKNKGGEIAKNITSDKEAVELGVGFEKESVSFYEGMLKAVSDEDKKLVNELIEQEKDHLNKLLELKKNI